MHLSLSEAKTLADEVATAATSCPDVWFGVAPPQLAVHVVANTLHSTNVMTLGQASHWASKGAFTGSVSAEQLRDAGARGVLVGHSERRLGAHETLADTQKMVEAAERCGLMAIVCVGENAQDKEAGRTESCVRAQLLAAIESSPSAESIVVAYEPVWAIGTGKTALPEDVQKVHGFLRSVLFERFGKVKGDRPALIYGGSVTPDSAPMLAQKPDVDGFLVGGASLSASSFIKIGEALRDRAQNP